MPFDKVYTELICFVWMSSRSMLAVSPRRYNFLSILFTWTHYNLLIRTQIHSMWNPVALPFLTGYVECSGTCWVPARSQWLRLWRWKCSFQLGVSYRICWCLFFFFHFFVQLQWALLKLVMLVPGTKRYPFHSTTSQFVMSFVASLQPTSLSLCTMKFSKGDC